MAIGSGDRRPLLVAAAATTVFAVLGTLMTELGGWYFALRQPSWKPPDALFGPIWTLIFALVAVAAATAWSSAPDAKARAWLVLVFVANGFLNVAWSLLFFRLQRPDWALAEVGMLWLSIVVMVAVTRRNAPRAALMLLPYLAWVTLAAALNYEVVRLNAPF